MRDVNGGFHLHVCASCPLRQECVPHHARSELGAKRPVTENSAAMFIRRKADKLEKFVRNNLK